MNFVLKGNINNILAFFHIMACHRRGDKTLSESMMFTLLTHICVTQSHWVKFFWDDMMTLWNWNFCITALLTLCWWNPPDHALAHLYVGYISILGYMCLCPWGGSFLLKVWLFCPLVPWTMDTTYLLFAGFCLHGITLVALFQGSDYSKTQRGNDSNLYVPK